MAAMSDPTQMAGQPSPEQMRAYLEQLREADAAGLVAEAFNLLATGAQVKLGRPDARPLIDGLAGMVQGVAGTLPPQLAQQMEQGVAQLKMAQVEAEREVAASTPAGEGDAADQSGGQSPPAAAAQPSASPGGPGANQRMTDRLWVPGRDPRPPGR